MEVMNQSNWSPPSAEAQLKQTELQKRANCANQLVLFFLAGANFWEKHASNCAIMCKFLLIFANYVLIFGANFFGGKIGRC